MVKSSIKKANIEVLLPMVMFRGKIPKVLDTSLVKAETTTSVSIKSLIFFPRAFNILIDIIFTSDPLSINTLDIDLP